MPDWRIAEQGFIRGDFTLHTERHGDGYVMDIRIGKRELAVRRRVFFDTAGRVTHVIRVDGPSQPQVAPTP